MLGFSYVATGKSYKEEANVSCRSLKQHMPTSHVTAFVDDVNHLETGLFDDVKIIPEPQFGFFDKIYAFLNSSYERTVFIDTDTRVYASLYELFEILDRFDLAAVRIDRTGHKQGCPSCFDDFNTGVIAMKICTRTMKFCRSWEQTYRTEFIDKGIREHDQPAFRMALYDCSDVSVYVLPDNYNVMLSAPILLGVDYKPKVLHGRVRDMDRIYKVLSSSDDVRFNLPNGTFVERAQLGVLDRFSGVPFNCLIRIARFTTALLRRLKRMLNG